jgi:hypothetical protein
MSKATKGRHSAQYSLAVYNGAVFFLKIKIRIIIKKLLNRALLIMHDKNIALPTKETKGKKEDILLLQ